MISARIPTGRRCDDDDPYGYTSLSAVWKKKLHENDVRLLSNLLALLRVEGAPQLDPRRGFDITASIASSICGENDYCTTHAIRVKKFLKIVEPENENTAHGHKYEPFALDKVRAATVDGSKVKCVYNIDYVKHARYEWLGGTVDGIAELEDGRVFLVEVKCPPKRRIIPGLVPDTYQSQIQLYMFITGLRACLFVQFKPKLTPRQKEVFDITIVRYDPAHIQVRLPLWKQMHDDMVMWKYVWGQVMLASANLLKALWRSRSVRRSRPSGVEAVEAARAVTRHHVVFFLVCHLCRRRRAAAASGRFVEDPEDADYVAMSKAMTSMGTRPFEGRLNRGKCFVRCVDPRRTAGSDAGACLVAFEPDARDDGPPDAACVDAEPPASFCRKRAAAAIPRSRCLVKY